MVGSGRGTRLRRWDQPVCSRQSPLELSLNLEEDRAGSQTPLGGATLEVFQAALSPCPQAPEPLTAPFHSGPAEGRGRSVSPTWPCNQSQVHKPSSCAAEPVTETWRGGRSLFGRPTKTEARRLENKPQICLPGRGKGQGLLKAVGKGSG